MKKLFILLILALFSNVASAQSRDTILVWVDIKQTDAIADSLNNTVYGAGGVADQTYLYMLWPAFDQPKQYFTLKKRPLPKPWIAYFPRVITLVNVKQEDIVAGEIVKQKEIFGVE